MGSGHGDIPAKIELCDACSPNPAPPSNPQIKPSHGRHSSQPGPKRNSRVGVPEFHPGKLGQEWAPHYIVPFLCVMKMFFKEMKNHHFGSAIFWLCQPMWASWKMQSCCCCHLLLLPLWPVPCKSR